MKPSRVCVVVILYWSLIAKNPSHSNLWVCGAETIVSGEPIESKEEKSLSQSETYGDSLPTVMDASGGPGDRHEQPDSNASFRKTREAEEENSVPTTHNSASELSSTATDTSAATADASQDGPSEGTSHSGNKRMWGASSAASETSDSNKHIDEQEKQPQNNTASSNGTPSSNSHLPFVPKVPSSSASGTHQPPEGYVIAARVYNDPQDKLAHFDDTPLALPYWECGVTGSTTSPQPIKDAYFRHTLAATTSTSWSGTDGKHPVLVVALTPLVMELNSNVAKEFQPGQVVLLEDVLLPGHKMRPLHNQDLQVLFLTLPQQHYRTGKEYLSLQAATQKHVNPCPSNTDAESDSSAASVVNFHPRRRQGPPNVRRVRTAIFTLLGISVSTLAADFLGKTAPLWLAVGVGGTCFVVAGTYGIAQGAEMGWTWLEVWRTQEKLKVSNRPSAQMEDNIQAELDERALMQSINDTESVRKLQ